MSAAMSTIRIKYADGFQTEQAVVCGSFAIHQTRYVDGSLSPEWTLTHVPSGYCVTQIARSEVAARQLWESITPLTDWSVLNPVPAMQADADKMAALRLALRTAIAPTCWITRQEFDQEYVSTDYVPCDHAVCLEDIRLHKLGYDHWESLWECPSGGCYLDRSRAECTLEPGHGGGHQWEEVGEPTLGLWTALPTPRMEPAS